jgi:multidrug efflux system membrane fusion protein
MSEGKSLRGKLIAATAIGLAVILAALVVFAIDRRPRTHDARIFAYSAQMAAEISGRVVRILVTNDQDVAKGARLLLIDPAPYEFQLRQARAEVAALKAQIALTGRQVTSQGSGVQAAMSQVQKARDQLTYAKDTRKRLEPLVKPGFVTQQQLDEAKTNEAAAEASLQALMQSATQARQAVGDTLSLEAQLEGAEAAEANAARNYDLTTLRAPFAGKVVGLRRALMPSPAIRYSVSSSPMRGMPSPTFEKRNCRELQSAIGRRYGPCPKATVPLRGGWRAWAWACSPPIKTAPVCPSSAAT